MRGWSHSIDLILYHAKPHSLNLLSKFTQIFQIELKIEYEIEQNMLQHHDWGLFKPLFASTGFNFYLFSELPLDHAALFANIVPIQLQKNRRGAKAC